MTRRSDPYEEAGRSPSAAAWLLRLSLLAAAVFLLLTALILLYVRWQEARLGPFVSVEGGRTDLSIVERVYLGSYLAANAEQLSLPGGSGLEPVAFTIAPGESAEVIAANLADAGLVTNTTLLRNYLRYYGLDARLEAGSFKLDPTLTTPQLATALTRAYAQEVVVRFVEGWRAGEMADALAGSQAAAIDANRFLDLVQRPAELELAQYDFLASLPVGSSLEGFLFPDTYRLPVDATAADLIRLMLNNFGSRVTPAIRQGFGVQGLSVYEAVTLASIVEREAALASERPLMAGVFLNRLRQDIRLEADPTVQYALGYQPSVDDWWKSPLMQADLTFDSAYNTYLYAGLPPGPIANPGLASLEAVARPTETAYLFFVTDCTAAVTGAHAFSTTYEEHLANVQRCR